MKEARDLKRLVEKGKHVEAFNGGEERCVGTEGTTGGSSGS